MMSRPLTALWSTRLGGPHDAKIDVLSMAYGDKWGAEAPVVQDVHSAAVALTACSSGVASMKPPDCRFHKAA
jgi:hypothetical protein